MSLEAATASLRVKICFTNLMVMREENIASSVQSGSGYLLIDATP